MTTSREARRIARALFRESFTDGRLDDAKVRQVWVGYRSRDETDIARAIVAALKESAPQAAGAPAAR